MTGTTGASLTDTSGPITWRLMVATSDEEDGERVRRAVRRAGHSATVHHVASLCDALEASGRAHFDVLLLDLPSSTCEQAAPLELWTRSVPSVPVLVLADVDDEAQSRRAFRAGAQDYLVRDECFVTRPERLLRAVRDAVARHDALADFRNTSRLRTTFVTAASHELRTPITIIRDYAWLLSDGTTGPLAPGQVECVEAILRNCTRLGALVRDLFDTARMESGTLVLAPEPTTVATLLIRCCNDFLACCESKSQHLELSLAGELGSLVCDRDRLTQVITNLLTNAHRFTPPGGVIALRGMIEGNEVRITVADTGVGIRPEDQDRIFDAFVQLDRRSAAGPQGTGLGLYIARRLVQMHAGTLTVCSTPGEGSAFTVALPVPPHTIAPEMLASAMNALVAAGERSVRPTSLIWLHTSSLPLDELERTVNALFRRHDAAYRCSQPATLACLLEGGRGEALGYLRRLQRALRPRGSSVHYRIESLPQRPTEALVPPPLATMFALNLCPPAALADRTFANHPTATPDSHEVKSDAPPEDCLETGTRR